MVIVDCCIVECNVRHENPEVPEERFAFMYPENGGSRFLQNICTFTNVNCMYQIPEIHGITPLQTVISV
jgi:hypothetical protein